MKSIIGMLTLLLVSSLVCAQSKSPKVLLPGVDSMVVEMSKLIVNPKDVKDIFVLKDPTPELLKLHRGAYVVMTFKKAPQLVSLNSLKG